MDKALYVREMFASIAPRYDAANRIITGGLDGLWRRQAIRELSIGPRSRVVDLCCGTGDLSFHLLRRDPTTRVTGVDFCVPMLDGARKRGSARATEPQPEFVEADVLQMPFDAQVFEGAIMGFAMRNVVDIDATLREIRRVLKPGRRFVNLDVSRAPNALFRRFFETYFFGVVPLIGGLIGGSRAAYRYLPNSLTNYPDADALAQRFRDAGFLEVRYIRLFGGAVAIHVGATP